MLPLDHKSKDFLEKVDYMIDKGVVKNDAEIIKTLDWNKSVMSSVRKGKIPLPQHIYNKFKEIYSEKYNQPIAADWKDDQIAFLKEQNDFFKMQIDDLKRQMDANLTEMQEQAKMNRAYLKTIYQALQEHRSKSEKVPLKEVQHDMDTLLASLVK